MGYPLTLHWAYNLFGASFQVGQALNIVYGVATLLVLYAIGRLIANRRVALLLMAAFTLWPLQLMYTSILASEHLATLLLMAIAWVVLRFQQQAHPALLILAGVLAGLLFEIRAVLVLSLIALMIVMLATPHTRRLIPIVVLSCVLTIAGYHVLMAEVYNSTAETSAIHLSLLFGTSIETGGTWDATISTNYYERTFEDCQGARQWALRTSFENVTQQPVSFALLAVQKTFNMWISAVLGAYYNRSMIDNGGVWVSIAQGFHVITLAAAVFGFYRLSRYADPRSIFPLALLALTLLAHIPLEVMERYHYPLIPILWLVFIISLKPSSQ